MAKTKPETKPEKPPKKPRKSPTQYPCERPPYHLIPPSLLSAIGAMYDDVARKSSDEIRRDYWRVMRHWAWLSHLECAFLVTCENVLADRQEPLGLPKQRPSGYIDRIELDKHAQPVIYL